MTSAVQRCLVITLHKQTNVRQTRGALLTCHVLGVDNSRRRNTLKCDKRYMMIFKICRKQWLETLIMICVYDQCLVESAHKKNVCLTFPQFLGGQGVFTPPDVISFREAMTKTFSKIWSGGRGGPKLPKLPINHHTQLSNWTFLLEVQMSISCPILYSQISLVWVGQKIKMPIAVNTLSFVSY